MLHESPEHVAQVEGLGLAVVNGKIITQGDLDVEIDVRDVSEKGGDKEKWLKEFDEWMESLDPSTPNLTDEQISRESIYEEQLLRQI